MNAPVRFRNRIQLWIVRKRHSLIQISDSVATELPVNVPTDSLAVITVLTANIISWTGLERSRLRSLMVLWLRCRRVVLAAGDVVQVRLLGSLQPPAGSFKHL